MAVYKKDDLSILYADFGLPLTYAGTTVLALDESTIADGVVDGSGRPLRTGERTLRIIAGSLPTLVLDAAVTFDGIAYKVRALPMEIGDRAEEELQVVKA